MARRTTTKAAPAPEATETAPVATEVEESKPDKVTLVGRLCADPVLRHTKSGKAVTTIRLAVNTPGSEASFHSVVVWERTAEVVCEYLRKGRRVEVSGRPQERSYEAADGSERQVTEIVASSVHFLPRQGAPLGALWHRQCRDCGTEYRRYADPEVDIPDCESCGLPNHWDQDGPFCDDCALSDCVYCGMPVHRWELSENLACPTCEKGEVDAA